MRPTVSVVIPYYRDQAGLDAVLEALAGQDHDGPLQVVVADDGSPVAPSWKPYDKLSITTVRQEDRGFRAAAARNLGAAATTGEVLAFLDGDTVPQRGYLSAVVTALSQEPHAVVVGTRKHVDLAGDPPRDLGEPQWLAEAWKATDHLREVDDTGFRYVISAVLSCRREVFEAVGGFDGSMTGYGGEDWEFAWQARQAGFDLRHEPRAVAVHRGEDWGGRRRTEQVRARREKNAESLRLAPRITHPTMRRIGVRHAVPDVFVWWDADSSGLDAGALAVVVGDLLNSGDVHVRVRVAAGPGLVAQPDGREELAAAFAWDPRVEVLCDVDQSGRGDAARECRWADFPGAPPGDRRTRPRFSVEVVQPCRIPWWGLQKACEEIAGFDCLGEIVNATGQVLFRVVPRRAVARGSTAVHRVERAWPHPGPELRLEDELRAEAASWFSS